MKGNVKGNVITEFDKELEKILKKSCHKENCVLVYGENHFACVNAMRNKDGQYCGLDLTPYPQIITQLKALFKKKARECVPEKRKNLSPAVSCLIDEIYQNIDQKFK